MVYTIEVDRETCIACAVCYSTDPRHFESDSDGKSRVIGGKSNGTSTGSFNDGLEADAKRAEASCPVSAISVKG